MLGSGLVAGAVEDVTFNKKHLTPTLEIVRQELTAPGLLPGINRIDVVSKSRKSDGMDSYEIARQADRLTITAQTDLGALYGAYHLTRLSDAGAEVPEHIAETPAFALRILNHWDNLDGISCPTPSRRAMPNMPAATPAQASTPRCSTMSTHHPSSFLPPI